MQKRFYFLISKMIYFGSRSYTWARTILKRSNAGITGKLSPILKNTKQDSALVQLFTSWKAPSLIFLPSKVCNLGEWVFKKNKHNLSDVTLSLFSSAVYIVTEHRPKVCERSSRNGGWAQTEGLRTKFTKPKPKFPSN